MVGRYGLSDEQWQRLGPLLPGRADTVGVTAKDNRLFVDAVCYRYRAGICPRDLATFVWSYPPLSLVEKGGLGVDFQGVERGQRIRDA